MVADHLSDFVTRIRNGYRAGLVAIDVPYTKIVEQVADLLTKKGYLAGIEKKATDKFSVLSVSLKYNGKKPAITGIRRVSKPGVRVYSHANKIPRVWGSLGINILTTNKGVLSEKEAKKLKAGGEIICQVW